jgi:hypothetical protein
VVAVARFAREIVGFLMLFLAARIRRRLMRYRSAAATL